MNINPESATILGRAKGAAPRQQKVTSWANVHVLGLSSHSQSEVLITLGDLDIEDVW